MEKREGISPIRTPGLWGKDLAIDARQNKLYYTHKLGCWLAAIEERLPRAATEKGNRWGGLLYRLPVGVWAGMWAGLVCFWPWFLIWFGRSGDMRRECQGLYLAAWFEDRFARAVTGGVDWRIALGLGLALLVAGIAIVHWSKERGFLTKFAAVVIGSALSFAGIAGELALVLFSIAPPEGKANVARAVYQFVKRVEPPEYAAGRDADGTIKLPVWMSGKEPVVDRIDGTRRVWMSVEPGRLVTWLDREVYHGPLALRYALLLVCELVTLTGLYVAGRTWDWWRRKRAMDGVYRRGARLVSLKEWNRQSIGPWWMRQRLGMSLRVSANGGCAHISTKKMITHMVEFIKTGGGKTINHTQILKIAEQNDWVVICSGAELMQKFHRTERGDYIIDPTLKLCATWATEKEIVNPIAGRGLTAGIFPMGPGEIKFFTDAVQEGLADIIYRYSSTNAPGMPDKEEATTRNLAKWLRNPGKHIMRRAKGTSIAARMNPKSGDQFAGMEGMFASASNGFGMMPCAGEGHNEFCARLWVEKLNRGEQPGWIWFPASGVTEKAIKPVTTAVLNYILALLRDAKDDVSKRRQLVIAIDEIVTNFNHIDEFEAAITNLRKFGVMIVFGAHAIAALREIYGHERTEVIVGQPGLQLIGPTDSNESAEYASAVLGKQDVWVLKQNATPKPEGGHRSLNYSLDTERDRALVTADDIKGLKDRHGYLRSGGFVVPILLSYRELPKQEFERREIRLVIDDDPDEEPVQQPGVPPKGETVAKIDGGPAIPYKAVQPQIEAAVAAEAKQRKMLRVLAFINTRKQGELPLGPALRHTEPAGVGR
jgi:hypothetical protein